MQKFRALLWAAAICVAVGLPAPASAQSAPQSVGNPIAGASAAQRNCSNCHVISGVQRNAPTDGAPTFQSIAGNPAMTATAIRLFIEIPHPRMANQMLSRAEIADIVAYILSLKPQ